jgi:hypothetical protein
VGPRCRREPTGEERMPSQTPDIPEIEPGCDELFLSGRLGSALVRHLHLLGYTLADYNPVSRIITRAVEFVNTFFTQSSRHTRDTTMGLVGSDCEAGEVAPEEYAASVGLGQALRRSRMSYSMSFCSSLLSRSDMSSSTQATAGERPLWAASTTASLTP